MAFRSPITYYGDKPSWKIVSLGPGRARVQKRDGRTIGHLERDPATQKWIGFTLDKRPTLPCRARRDAALDLVWLDAERDG